jgi:hypothetical protein
MDRLKRAIAAAAAMVVATAIYAGVAAGHDGGGKGRGEHHGNRVLDQALAPSQTTDPHFHGVGPGGVPWVLKRGEARLRMDGRFELRLDGLVIPTTGNTGPVTSITASLYCGEDANGTAVDTTPSVPLSTGGDARIRDDSFTVPSTCLAPIVMVHPNGNAAAYIAITGFRM